MAEKHRRGNREVRKPKKQKETIPTPVASIKGATASIKIPKKS